MSKARAKIVYSNPFHYDPIRSDPTKLVQLRPTRAGRFWRGVLIISPANGNNGGHLQ